MVTVHIIKTEEKLLFILSPCLLKVSECSFSFVWCLEVGFLIIIYYHYHFFF